jgi:YtxH-like protein
MRRDNRSNLLRLLLGAGLYLLDPVRDRLADRLDDLSERAQDVYEGAADRVSSVSDRIRGRRSDTLANVTWLLVGAGVGVGLGMLFAPAAGEETRSNLTEKVQKAGDKVRERFNPQPRPASGTYGE